MIASDARAALGRHWQLNLFLALGPSSIACHFLGDDTDDKTTTTASAGGGGGDDASSAAGGSADEGGQAGASSPTAGASDADSAQGGQAGYPQVCPPGTSACEGACVDTENNPRHCGDCEQTCRLPQADAACVGGKCAVLACHAGFANDDGEPANGCELEPCRVKEHLQPAPSGALTTCPRGNCEEVATCTLDGHGGLHMSYEICTGQSDWAVCDWGGAYDFSTFDSAFAGNDLLEVRFCVAAPITSGGLNLWYGRHPLRKALALKDAGTRLETGCYVRYFESAQAQFPDWCDIPTDCEPGCGATTKCDSAFAQLTEQWVSSIVLDEECRRAENDALPAGEKLGEDELVASWSEFRTEAAMGAEHYSLAATRLSLAAEGCTSTTTGSLHVQSIKLLSRSCACTQELGCSAAGDRQRCYEREGDSCLTAPEGVCGLSDIGCIGPPGPGIPCEVTLNGATQAGLTRCEQGGYVCTID